MNKTFLMFSALIGLTLSASSQNKNVVSAINYVKYYEQDKNCDNLKSAQEFIDLATSHAETKESPKMWYYRGTIYQMMNDSKDPKCKALSKNSIMEAVEAYQNSLKFDTKKTYEQDVKQRLSNAAAGLTNEGVKEFQNKNYANALTLFESSINVSQKAFNRVDTISYYNAALAAEKCGNNEKAKEMFRKLIDMKAGGKDGSKYYTFLSKIYEAEKDTANFRKVLVEGRKAFPDDLGLILAETNIYLNTPGKEKEATANLQAAIAKDPNNYNLHFALGSIYDRMNDFDNAEKSYKKTLDIKPDFFDALFNIGALYYNKAVKINEAANSIKDNAKYQKEAARADEYFKTSLPYLEKALEVNPKDKATMQSLKAVYARLEMQDKYKKIDDMMKN